MNGATIFLIAMALLNRGFAAWAQDQGAQAASHRFHHGLEVRSIDQKL
jgi:hypothetical protein